MHLFSIVTAASVVLPTLVLSQSAVESSATASPSPSCQPSAAPKVLTWNRFFISGGPVAPARPVQEPIKLQMEGSGWVYREDDNLTRPLLFENDQNWSVINCSHTYKDNPVLRKSCTSQELALFSGRTTKPAGIIGTLKCATYPRDSPWLVVDLRGFKVTAVVGATTAKGKVDVEVFGWKENGQKAARHKATIDGSTVGSYVLLPKSGAWLGLVQWQIIISQNGKLLQYVLDDADVTEHAREIEYQCPRETPDPGKLGPVKTIKFSSLPAGPLPDGYQGFRFNTGPQQSWNIRPTGPGKPNALYARPHVPSDEEPYLDFTLLALAHPFESVSARITVDVSTLPPNTTLADVNLTITANSACSGNRFNQYNGVYNGPLGAVSSTVSLRNVYEKPGRLSFQLPGGRNQDGYPYSIGFWIEEVRVQFWELELSGCYRCRKYLGSRCEYPAVNRSYDPVPV